MTPTSTEAPEGASASPEPIPAQGQNETGTSVADEKPIEQTVYVFSATTKRVAAAGDSFQILLEMSGMDWLRYVSSGLHKGTNTIVVRPEQLRWEPPTTEPQRTVCEFDEELQKYRCKDQTDALDEPCEHYVIEDLQERGVIPSENGDSSKWYGRRRKLDGSIIEGREACPNPECGRRAPKLGESHSCTAIRTDTTVETEQEIPF